MSQPRHTPSPHHWGQRSWLRKLSYLSGVGILSSGVAVAQAPSEIPQIIIAAPSEALPSKVAAPLSESAIAATANSSPVSTPERVAPESSHSDSALIEKDAASGATNPALVNSSADDYDAPSTIVFSERSSGCEFALKQGQTLSSGVCGGQAVAATPRSSARSTRYSSSRYSIVPASTAPARSQAVTISSSGISVTQPVLSASAFVKDYYNRSVRPLGHSGNGGVRLLFPLSIPSVITSVFGWRVHPISGSQRFHSGTDLGAPMGTPVLAALTGQVVLADFFGGYGLAIAIEHAQGTQQTLYAHLSEIFVKPGEVVKQGTVIGRVGSTGNSTGPHLHFELRQLTTEGWVAQDPGVQLESALAQLVNSLQTAQKVPALPERQAKPGSVRSSS